MSLSSSRIGHRPLVVAGITALITATGLYVLLVIPIQEILGKSHENNRRLYQALKWQSRTTAALAATLDARLKEFGMSDGVEPFIAAIAADGDSTAVKRYSDAKHALERTRVDRAWTETFHLAFATEGASALFDNDRHVEILSHEERENGWHCASLVEVSAVDGSTRRVRIHADAGAWLRLAGTEYRLYLVRNRTVSTCDLYMFRRMDGNGSGNARTPPSKS